MLWTILKSSNYPQPNLENSDRFRNKIFKTKCLKFISFFPPFFPLFISQSCHKLGLGSGMEGRRNAVMRKLEKLVWVILAMLIKLPGWRSLHLSSVKNIIIPMPYTKDFYMNKIKHCFWTCAIETAKGQRKIKHYTYEKNTQIIKKYVAKRVCIKREWETLRITAKHGRGACVLISSFCNKFSLNNSRRI